MTCTPLFFLIVVVLFWKTTNSFLKFDEQKHNQQRRYLAEDSSELFASNVERFANISNDNREFKKNTNLLLFISITSGPRHAALRQAIRNTWILPCKVSEYCDYRFFVDAPQSRLTDTLRFENAEHNDMIFRNSCSLMNRHSDLVHYGNAAPIGGNLNATIPDPDDLKETILVPNPDYENRRFYKIDWKVCFMRWCRDHGRMAEYHVFVEDDSFQCTENLLYQAAILYNRTSTESNSKAATDVASGSLISEGNNVNTTTTTSTTKYLPFRTGTRLYNGFDDSSTFMSKEIALAFANHYLEDGFNCSRILNTRDDGILSRTGWLSWGNSWMSANCDWRDSLHTHFDMHINTPNTYCLHARIDKTRNAGDGGGGGGGSVNSKRNNSVITLGCMPQALILHHWNAAHILMSETKPRAKVKHICEYMLLVDKVKDVRSMYALWNSATAHNYHDFSDVFLGEETTGWNSTIHKLQHEEDACRDELIARYKNNSSAGHKSSSSSTIDNTETSTAEAVLVAEAVNETEIMQHYNMSNECIFERESRRLKNIEVSRKLYGRRKHHRFASSPAARWKDGGGEDAIRVTFRDYF